MRGKSFSFVVLLLTISVLISACASTEIRKPQKKGTDNVLSVSATGQQSEEATAQPIPPAEETAPQELTPLEAAIAQGGYDSAVVWDWAEYATVSRSAGVRQGLVQREDGTRSIGEVPDTKYWILLRDGSLLTEEPFDACMDFAGAPYGEVYCTRDGFGYRYAVCAEDGSFELLAVDEPGAQEGDFFGWRLCVYRWDSREPCYGIVGPDGESVIDPVYERVEIPFSDRFLLYEGGASQGPVMGRCRLTDAAGKTMCDSFHEITYSVFDSGYLGIAVCFGEKASYPCYDAAGEPMIEGCWLVDADGNICSERFARLSFSPDPNQWAYQAETLDSVLYAVRADGTEETFAVEELLIFWGAEQEG